MPPYPRLAAAELNRYGPVGRSDTSGRSYGGCRQPTTAAWRHRAGRGCRRPQLPEARTAATACRHCRVDRERECWWTRTALAVRSQRLGVGRPAGNFRVPRMPTFVEGIRRRPDGLGPAENPENGGKGGCQFRCATAVRGWLSNWLDASTGVAPVTSPELRHSRRGQTAGAESLAQSCWGRTRSVRHATQLRQHLPGVELEEAFNLGARPGATDLREVNVVESCFRKGEMPPRGPTGRRRTACSRPPCRA